MSDRTAALLAWYDAHRRDLPWRDDADPYRVLVSEVMLQQTQVARVIDRYERFLSRFPTVEALAAAPLAEVLAEWSGLGYNRRARNLHRAAAQISSTGWPRTVPDLLELPGVGAYTAAAVASICFGAPEPAVDTNLRRVLGRWQGSPLTDPEATSLGATLIDAARPGDWNQALMDLGAAHCSPRDPSCSICPVESWCTDATIYQPPRPQGRFEGSSREARGAVVRHLLEGPATVAELVAASGLALNRIEDACAGLDQEGLIEATEDGYRLSSE